ncbi:MAG: hypothetical protein C4325_05590, partial [Blastocatellia bacterium]
MTLRIAKSFGASILLIVLLGVVLSAQQPSKKELKRAEDLIRQAEKAFKAKDYKTSVEKYAEALIILPKNASAHFWKGYAHYYRKEFDLAAKELTLAQELGYSAIEVAKVRWIVNYQLGNHDDALRDIESALSFSPDDPALLRAAGDIYYEKKRYKEALAAFQRAAVRTP